jgi:uncharacterized damage-inducible protein DinB
MKLACAIFVSAAILGAQSGSDNPLIDSSKGMYAIVKNDILKSADKIPDSMWTFQPTPEIRTVGQLFGHIADAQYGICGAVYTGTKPSTSVEKTAKTKAEIVTAVKAAFAFCDAAYNSMTDANAAETVKFFGHQATKVAVMDFNVAHTFEHYGNLVTYMRIKNIVPPSSEGQ